MGVSLHTGNLILALLFGCMGFFAGWVWSQRRQLAWVLLGVMWLAPVSTSTSASTNVRLAEIAW